MKVKKRGNMTDEDLQEQIQLKETGLINYQSELA